MLTRSLRTSISPRLLIKRLMYPGTNWISRDKSRLVKTLLFGSDDKRLQTLDCGCGNAYFTFSAFRRGSDCMGITIHDWERRSCEEMREYLGIPADRVAFSVTRLSDFAADRKQRGRFDQILLLDVIEHILDDGAALRQLSELMADDGFIFITTPDRDWQVNIWGPRVTRYEDGWHVRNGYTFEQLEAVLQVSGFEPIDRLRFGTLGSAVVMAIQQRIFRAHADALTVICFPVLKFIAWTLSPWKRSHTIFVVARKVAPKDTP